MKYIYQLFNSFRNTLYSWRIWIKKKLFIIELQKYKISREGRLIVIEIFDINTLEVDVIKATLLISIEEALTKNYKYIENEKSFYDYYIYGFTTNFSFECDRKEIRSEKVYICSDQTKKPDKKFLERYVEKFGNSISEKIERYQITKVFIIETKIF